MSTTSGPGRRWTELEKLYEREKRWEELAGRFSTSRRCERRPGQTRRHPAQAGHGVTPRSCRSPTWRWPRGRRCWMQSPRTRPRAGCRCRKLYLQNKDWDALEGFLFGPGQVGRVRAGAGAAGPKRKRARRGSGCWNKIAVLYRDRLNKPDKAQKAFEKTLSSMATTLVAAEALIPMYERDKDAKRLAGVLQVQLEQHPGRGPSARNAMLRIAQILEGDAGDKPLAAHGGPPCRRYPRIRARNGRCEYARAAGRRDGQLGSAGGSLRGRFLPSLQDRMPLPRSGHSGASLREGVGQHRGGHRAQPGDSRDRGSRRAGRIGSRTPVCGPPASTTIQLLAIYDKKLALAGSEDEKREVRLQARGALRRTGARRGTRRSSSTRTILKTAKEDVQALRALDRLYRAQPSAGKDSEQDHRYASSSCPMTTRLRPS